jgi:hypothetical protein
MNDVMAHDSEKVPVSATPSNGSILRRSAITGAVSFTALVAAAFALTPARDALPTALATWALVIVGATLTYVAGRAVTRSAPLQRFRASRRTERWLARQRG